MKSFSRMGRQKGAALVVSLILLLVLTLLGVSGLSTATLELTMAGNTQFQENAFQAAETGIERALVAPGMNTGIPLVFPEAAAFPADPNTTIAWNNAFQTLGLPPPGFSLDDFSSYHFQITSTGRGTRNATSTHVQGFFIVGPRGD